MFTARRLRSGLLFLFGGASLAHAATLTVSADKNGCPNAMYDTINGALSASSSGDEIDVCPGLYQEQLIITQPVTIRGVASGGSQRAVLQPSTYINVQNPLNHQQGAPQFVAPISIVNTSGVAIEGLVIDASLNSVSGCTVTLAGIHFSNASGQVSNNVIVGAQLSSPLTCTTLFPGNGFGVQVDTAASQTGPFLVAINGNTIHDFNRNGILVNGAGITADITGNTISGVGPSTGYNQFGVFIANGAVAYVSHNVMTQGNCGTITVPNCIPLRSEGVVFRNVGDGSVADSNFITNVQSGIFVNGGNLAQITNNVIMNVDALDGIDIQGTAAGHFTNSVISGNTISHVFPIGPVSPANEGGCGINETVGTGVAQNLIANNSVNDAYCGVGFVTTDEVSANTFTNTLFGLLNLANAFPPATEP